MATKLAASSHHPHPHHAKPAPTGIHALVDNDAPPAAFLAELVAWGRRAPNEIFIHNASSLDVYTVVAPYLGSYGDLLHRRAVMLEVLRVLGHQESQWDWQHGTDSSAVKGRTLAQIEAGLWQVSSNSSGKGASLRLLLAHYQLCDLKTGHVDPEHFQFAMKHNHPLAMEYIARLLRITCGANGPLHFKEALKHTGSLWRRDAVQEFEKLLRAK